MEVCFHCQRVTQELTLWSVGRIGYQEEPSTNLRSVGLLSITPPIPSHIHGEIEHGATDMMAAPEPRTPLRPEHGSPDHPASAYHEDVDMWAVHPTVSPHFFICCTSTRHLSQRSMTSAVQSYPTNENNPSGMLPTRYTTTHNSAGIFDYSLHTQTVRTFVWHINIVNPALTKISQEYGSRVHPSPTGTFLIWPQVNLPLHCSPTKVLMKCIIALSSIVHRHGCTDYPIRSHERGRQRTGVTTNPPTANFTQPSPSRDLQTHPTMCGFWGFRCHQVRRQRGGRDPSLRCVRRQLCRLGGAGR